MFTAAVFILTRKWKEPKFPLTGVWINKTQYTFTIECYLALQRNEVLLCD